MSKVKSSGETIRVKEFFDDEFREFSRYDNVRSIPSVRDGFKPSQRKSVFGMLHRGENADEIQVERVAANVAAVSMYHHGTGSLEGTIIGLAQNYAGSNNMNIFEPSGQFGSRLSSEGASPRYVFTRFSENFRKLFKKDDDIILRAQLEDGNQIEPEYYIPILPTVLINGSSGTGTGHASLILNYNPDDLKKYVLNILAGKKNKDPLVPWYRGFHGTVWRNDKQTVIEGVLEVINTTTIHVTELPIGMYMDDFKSVLNKLEDAGFIKDYENYSTEERFDFRITVPRSTTALEIPQLMQKFKLIRRDTENFTLWDVNGKIKDYESAEAIVDEFVQWRLERYEERRQKLIDMYNDELGWLNNKLRFIMFYLKNSKDFSNKNKAEMIEILEKNKFIEIDKLIRIPIYVLTKDEIEKLKNDIADVEGKISNLEATNANEMYKKELTETKLS